MSKWNLTLASESGYETVVNDFRFRRRPPLTGNDVVYGHVAKKLNDQHWVKNTSFEYPLQYKFESGGIRKLSIYALVPLGTPQA